MKNQLIIPELIQRRSKEILQAYQMDENWRVILELLAKKYNKSLKDENISKFILDYFMEINVLASLYFEEVTNKLIQNLESDNIYKGIRLRYKGGSLLEPKVLYNLSELL